MVKKIASQLKIGDRVLLNQRSSNDFDLIGYKSSQSNGYIATVLSSHKNGSWFVRTTIGTIVCSHDTVFYLAEDTREQTLPVHRNPGSNPTVTKDGISLD